ncbi:MAG: hypothetical protein JNL97_10215 [Verrucomicrobiales bacterium]|nr:hypothetical protein [Verrucomicrobiales bacterium]
MAENLNSTGGSAPDAATLDRWLWAYAAGMMEPDEEARLLSYVSRVPAAFSRLEEIRGRLNDVIARRAPALADARAQAAPLSVRLANRVEALKREWFGNLSDSLEAVKASLLAVAVVRCGGVFALAQRAGVVCAGASGPVLLGAEGSADASGGSGSPSRQSITAPDGAAITLSVLGEGEVDLVLELPDKRTRGMVQLNRLTIQGAEVRRQPLAMAPLEEGVAHFPRCPLGLLELVRPGAVPWMVGVGPGQEPPASV